jgi:glycerophosphoryl diester phosphodiesterase
VKWTILLLLFAELSSASPMVVIAHRGASGYLPEHTLEAKALAIAMGADYVEQDVVLTKDDVPIVTHEIVLDEVTDIAARYPGRARSDGHYYALDFTLAELRLVSRHERVRADGKAVYPGRFPVASARFRIVTLAEEIEFVQGLNRTLGRDVGLYTEVKSPAWHRAQGRDITRIVLDTLSRYGYSKRTDNIYFQCFDADENRRVRREFNSDLKVIQLIGENAWHESETDYDAMRTSSGIAAVASYADGIGPSIDQLVEWPSRGAVGRATPLARWARENHLLMHPYTLRTDDLPRHAPNATAVLDALREQAGVQGLFTDFPDVAVAYRASH